MFSSEILAPATFQANCILPKCFPMSASLGGLTSNIYFLVGKIPLFGIFLKKYFVAKPYFSLGYQMSQLEQNIDDFADPRFSFWHNTLDWVSCDSPAPLSEDWVENETYVSPYIDQTSTEYRWNVMEHRQNTEGTLAQN